MSSLRSTPGAYNKRLPSYTLVKEFKPFRPSVFLFHLHMLPIKNNI
jgi:hypothetical protein